MFQLTPDVRYFYLCLLTNPERNTTAAFKCSDRLMCAYTGYNPDTVNLCRNVLVVKEFIEYIDGYYILNNQDHVEPTKGKLSQSLHDKYMSELPRNIATILRSGSGVAQEYIYKDNNKDTNTTKNTYGEFKNVLLSQEDYKNLTDRMGEKNTSYLIEELSGYMSSKGKKYKNHYATIQNWARRKVGEIKKAKNSNAF